MQYLLPWLYNLELMDPNLPASNYQEPSIKDPSTEFMKPPLKGKGWGSPEASNMVLNNLVYATLIVSMAFYSPLSAA